MTATETDILSKALGWRKAGQGVAIATVVETWGSAPRPVGSRLVINSDGQFAGSVSGGCVEGDVIAEAVDIIHANKPKLLEFGVSDELAWKAGLSCGGRIKVYVEKLGDDLTACLEIMTAAHEARRPVALLTDMKGGAPRVVAQNDIGSDPVSQQIDALLRAEKSGFVEHLDMRLFVTVQAEQTRLVIVGAVHIAQALATMARLVNIDVTIVDPRSAFADAERFPGVALLREWPDDVLAQTPLDRTTAIALLSHDPRIDDPALVAALKSECFYIGALGSRRTHAKRMERMRAAGRTDADLVRIHAPIGLDIGAAGPAEIAVAILAQIVATRRCAPVRSASDRAA